MYRLAGSLPWEIWLKVENLTEQVGCSMAADLFYGLMSIFELHYWINEKKVYPANLAK